MPSLRSARTPPTPRISSWWRRMSRPRTYRMWLMGRSLSRCQGCRCPAAAAARARPGPARPRHRRCGRADPRVTMRGPPPASTTRRAAAVPGIEVEVVVFLVAVGIDGLAEVATPIEQAHRHERQGHIRGCLAVVASQHARGRRSRWAASRGARIRRRSRPPGRPARSHGGARTSGRGRWSCRRRSDRGRSGSGP